MSFQRCGISASISESLSVFRSASDHSSRLNVGERFVVGEHDRERAEFFVEPLEQGVDRLLDRLGDDQLVAVPRVREFGGGERLGQLGALVEVPRLEVVVDLDLVGVVRVEVDRLARVGALAALLVSALLVHECHEGTLPPVPDSLR